MRKILFLIFFIIFLVLTKENDNETLIPSFLIANFYGGGCGWHFSSNKSSAFGIAESVNKFLFGWININFNY